jgi:hemerythrin-like metal-binding protein
MNALLAAFEKGTARREDISKIVQFLTVYIVFRFGTEEKHRERFGYSSTRQHKAQHEHFVKAFLRLKERLLMEGVNEHLSKDTKELVGDWLLNHIKYADRAPEMFLKLKMS